MCKLPLQMAFVPEKEEGRIATSPARGVLGNNRPESLTSIPSTTAEPKNMYTQGSVMSREAVNMISVRDNLATSLLEVHRRGNKNVEILDILYLDFQVAFDNFSAKFMKIVSHHGLNEKSFCDLKMESKVKGSTVASFRMEKQQQQNP